MALGVVRDAFVSGPKTLFIRPVAQLIDTLSASDEVRKQVPEAGVEVGEVCGRGPETQILAIENFPLLATLQGSSPSPGPESKPDNCSPVIVCFSAVCIVMLLAAHPLEPFPALLMLTGSRNLFASSFPTFPGPSSTSEHFMAFVLRPTSSAAHCLRPEFFMLRATKILLFYLLFAELLATVAPSPPLRLH